MIPTQLEPVLIFAAILAPPFVARALAALVGQQVDDALYRWRAHVWREMATPCEPVTVDVPDEDAGVFDWEGECVGEVAE